MPSIEKTIQGWRVSDIRGGQYLTRHYIGYNKKESLAEFRAEFPQRKKKRV